MTSHANSLDAGGPLSAYGYFSVGLLLVSVGTLVNTFLVPLFTQPSELSGHIIFHGLAFLGWYVLVVFQSLLINRRAISLHRRIGYVTAGFVVVLVVSGALLLIGVMQSYQPDWSESYLRSRTSFVWAIFHTLVFFTTACTLAYVKRGVRHTHVRLVTLASLSMIAPSLTRIAYLPFVPIDGTLFTLLGTYLFLAIPFVLDRLTLGYVHPVSKWGIPLYVVTQIVAIGLLPSSNIGRTLAFAL